MSPEVTSVVTQTTGNVVLVRSVTSIDPNPGHVRSSPPAPQMVRQAPLPQPERAEGGGFGPQTP